LMAANPCQACPAGFHSWRRTKSFPSPATAVSFANLSLPHSIAAFGYEIDYARDR